MKVLARVLVAVGRERAVLTGVLVAMLQAFTVLVGMVEVEEEA